MYLKCCKLDGEIYVSWHPELLGCMSDGATPEEALANLDEARELMLGHLRKFNLPIPEPMSMLDARISVAEMWL